MIKYFYISFFLVGTIIAVSQPNPQSKKITNDFFPDYQELLEITPALKKKKGFTNYEELMTFLNSLKNKFPDKIEIKFIGESQKGYEIPIVFLNSENKNNLKVWFKGGLHGNEPAGTEGLLYLLDRLLNDGSLKQLLDNTNIAILPMANIDGYIKQNRYASNGLDLNRDQTKLMALESINIKQAFTNFNPDIAVDFHEYRPYRKDFARMSDFGITSVYDVMFLYSGNLNVSGNIRAITDTLFVENARSVLDNFKLRHHDYISTTKYLGEIQFNQGSTNARSSATSYALNNTISTLIEIRGVGIGKTSFKRRVNSAFSIALSYLKTTVENSDFIKSELKKSLNYNSSDIVVTSSRTVEKEIIQTIDLNSNKIIDYEVTIRDALRSNPTLVRDRPLGYLILEENIELIEKLRVLGLEVNIVENDTIMKVEKFKITDYNDNFDKYEKMNLQSVKALLVEDEITIKQVTYLILTNQRTSNILTELLEPEAPNSFVSFGILKTEINQILPIYRLIN
jgi:hypothetical protein